MCWSRLIPLLLFSNAACALEGFMIGAGGEGDSDDGLSLAVVGGVGLTEDTWLSGAVARSEVDLVSGRKLETEYADIELDHYFDPIGVRVGAAYWGDSDVLTSNDWRASGYFRNDRVTLSLDYEFRDFEFIIPSTDFATSRQVLFDADGIGVSARIKTSKSTNLRLRGIKYDYSIPFRPVENADAARLLSVSRLSLINSLVDHRASLSLGIESGKTVWDIDLTTWEGAISGSRTKSLTVRFLVPLSQSTDIELGIGYDDSELYGDVTFFSLYLFFYGD
ncbi:MAG: hypothetical protein QNI96_01955 [Woeseiaceae bacterium]|nr:hypothetical protein [Woeseiaceae bacterium]